MGLGPDSTVNAPTLLNSSFLSVHLGNPFKGASEKGPNQAKLLLRFSPSSVINETLIRFDFSANTSSELVVDSSTFLHCVIVKRAEVTIQGRGAPEAVIYGGEVRGESALREEVEVGPAVSHRYLVKNYGPSTVDVVTVRVAWPHQVSGVLGTGIGDEVILSRWRTGGGRGSGCCTSQDCHKSGMVGCWYTLM